MADRSKSIVCGECGNRRGDLKRCARCRRVLYCCREHQVKHWKIHKSTCRRLYSNDPENACNRSDDVASVGSGQALPVSPTSRETDIRVDADTTDNFEGQNAASSGTGDKPYIDFDERPYTHREFAKPPSYDHGNLADFITSKLKASGWCVVEDLFKEDVISRVVREFHAAEENGAMSTGKLSGGRTCGEDMLKVVVNEIRSDKIAWVSGNEGNIPAICEVMETLDDIVGRFNGYLKEECIVKGRTKAMMACYPGGGSFYRRHVDNPNKNGRVITCILYLNEDWDVQRDGGMLRILPRGSDDHVDIAPQANRTLFFWSDWRNPHEVQPAHRTRYALTVWYFDAEERAQAKEESINNEVLQIGCKLSLLDVQTKKAESQHLNQKITNESMKAVAELSQDELDAFAALMKDQPDPDVVLASLGIAASIRAVLLDVLRVRPSSS